jgi:hypothetical protein
MWAGDNVDATLSHNLQNASDDSQDFVNLLLNLRVKLRTFQLFQQFPGASGLQGDSSSFLS